MSTQLGLFYAKRLESNSNEEVLHIPQISRTGDLQSDGI